MGDDQRHRDPVTELREAPATAEDRTGDGQRHRELEELREALGRERGSSVKIKRKIKCSCK